MEIRDEVPKGISGCKILHVKYLVTESTLKIYKTVVQPVTTYETESQPDTTRAKLMP